MQSSICRACQKSLDINSGKCIFDENTTIKSFDINGVYDDLWEMSVYAGLEIITGTTLSEDNLPKRLCDVCFQSVEAYVNFRCHLLKTRDPFVSKYKKTAPGTSFSAESNKSAFKPVSKIKTNSLVEKHKVADLLPNNSEDSKISNNSSAKTSSEDLINVDEDSMSFDINIDVNEEKKTNNSLINGLQNDKKNNNSEINSSTFSSVHSSTKNDLPIIAPEPTKESEIDVCSVEDDEVLELDVPKKRNEIVEIFSSSSESDIEVCDYEPPCKRKTYSILTRPARL